jgi:hypothetical protein
MADDLNMKPIAKIATPSLSMPDGISRGWEMIGILWMVKNVPRPILLV